MLQVATESSEKEVLAPDERSAPAETLIRLEADLDKDGRFGRQVLEVTRDVVRVREGGQGVRLEIPIERIKGARNEPLVGGGRLEVTTRRGQIVPVVAYTLSVAASFSEAARGIEQLAKGEALSINLKREKTRCEKCGRLLPEKDGICPACINRGRTFLRVTRYLRPYLWQAALLAALNLVSTLIFLVPPYVQGELIDKVLSPQRNLRLLWLLTAVWLSVLLVRIGIQVASGRLTAWLAGHVAADLRSSVYRAIEFLQLGYFEKKQVGAITSRVTQDTDRIWGFLCDGMPFVISNALLIVGIVVLLLQINWTLTACILSPIPIVIGISALFWRRMASMFHKVGQKWARFHTNLNEALSGIRVVKAFAKEDFENSKFLKRNHELRDAGVQADGWWHSLFGVMSFFTALGAVINWVVGGYMVYRGTLSMGDFWKVNAYIALVYGPMHWFAQVNNWFSRAMAGAERIFEVIDTEKEPYGEPGTHHPIAGRITFENVRFGYDKSNPVLKDLSFDIQAGEMIGLVGKSGAGKSTTISLICRFYEPDAGTIRIDGIDYRQIALQDLRRQVGLVLQEPFLFNGSIAENIAYGRADATFHEIVEAARAANAHEFILAKPDGYDTVVGERGAKLSGGERQRISIARAILHDPRILILDEATSSVDVETERKLQEAIARLVKGRTTFAIAHRLSTLRNANRLIVLEKGQITEMGTHAELMDRKGVFHKLVQTQTEVSQVIAVTG